MNDLALTEPKENALAKLSRQTPGSLSQVGFWHGDLLLKFSTNDSGKTIISERQHQGPYTVQRPFYPEGHICHSILLHPPGGLVEGDELSLRVECEEKSHCLITTPSAGKVYECQQVLAAQKQVFLIKDKAKLEWFPQEMILYDKSQSKLTTDIYLTGTGQFVGWEMLCMGRPIANDHFRKGKFNQTIRLYREDKPLLIERFVLNAQSALRTQRSGLADYQAMALYLMTGANKESLESARQIVSSFDESLQKNIQLGFTLIDDVLVGRALMNQSRFAKQAFTKVWSALRLPLLNTSPINPRIWNT